jgi:hypothetical protein
MEKKEIKNKWLPLYIDNFLDIAAIAIILVATIIAVAYVFYHIGVAVRLSVSTAAL